MVPVVKNPPASSGDLIRDTDSIPGLGRFQLNDILEKVKI